MVIFIMAIQPGWAVRTTSNVRMRRYPRSYPLHAAPEERPFGPARRWFSDAVSAAFQLPAYGTLNRIEAQQPVTSG